MSASSGRSSSTGSSRRSVLSSTSVITQPATIGFVIEAMRQIVSAAIGVLEPAPSKARLPIASMWTSPWRATTATARRDVAGVDVTAEHVSYPGQPFRRKASGAHSLFLILAVCTFGRAHQTLALRVEHALRTWLYT